MKKQGFTLIELIVVLALLAIISAIAIPLSMRSISNAHQTACNASVNSVYSQYRIFLSDELFTTNSFTFEKEKQLLQQSLTHLSPVCPSGGVYSVQTQSNTLWVACSKHPNRKTSAAVGDDAAKQLAAAFAGLLAEGNTLATGANKRIDSVSADILRNRTAIINRLLQSAGFHVDAMWSIQYSNNAIDNVYVADTYSIQDATTGGDTGTGQGVGQWVAVTQYNPTTNSFTKGYAKIFTNTVEGNSVRAINFTTFTTDTPSYVSQHGEKKPG